MKTAFLEPKFNFKGGYGQIFLIFCPVLALRPFFGLRKVVRAIPKHIFWPISPPTAESWYPGILDTEILRVKDRVCRDFSGVWKKFLLLLITKLTFFASISKLWKCTQISSEIFQKTDIRDLRVEKFWRNFLGHDLIQRHWKRSSFGGTILDKAKTPGI